MPPAPRNVVRQRRDLRFADHDFHVPRPLSGAEWAVADMRTLALGERFRGLVAWGSFFRLAHDDQRRMFLVFRAHAAPGAALLFTSGPSHGEAIGAYGGEPLYHASLVVRS